MWRIERFVSEISCLRKALELETLYIYGHSWGTMLAVDYMLTDPSGVKGLVLSGPCLNAQRWKEDCIRLITGLPARTRETIDRCEKNSETSSQEYQQAIGEFMKNYVCRIDPLPPDLQKVFNDINIKIYHSMWGPSEFYPTGNLKDYDRTDELRKIRVPTLFISGQYDEATPETALFYTSKIEGARLVVIKDSSHMAMFEQPEKYINEMKNFPN